MAKRKTRRQREADTLAKIMQAVDQYYRGPCIDLGDVLRVLALATIIVKGTNVGIAVGDTVGVKF